VASGEVPRGEKMLYSGTDPEPYITEYTLVYEDNRVPEIAFFSPQNRIFQYWARLDRVHDDRRDRLHGCPQPSGILVD